jgi:hypothetical protein
LTIGRFRGRSTRTMPGRLKVMGSPHLKLRLEATIPYRECQTFKGDDTPKPPKSRLNVKSWRVSKVGVGHPIKRGDGFGPRRVAGKVSW